MADGAAKDADAARVVREEAAVQSGKEFAAADANADGKLSREEWIAKHGTAEGFAEYDLDGDGVVDSKDQCSNTETNASVDLDGCSINLQTDSEEDSFSNLQYYSAVVGIIGGALGIFGFILKRLSERKAKIQEKADKQIQNFRDQKIVETAQTVSTLHDEITKQ